MSNHVHLLMKPLVPAGQCMQWIKGVSTRKANEILHRTRQPFWQKESYDHWVRSAGEGQGSAFHMYLPVQPPAREVKVSGGALVAS